MWLLVRATVVVTPLRTAHASTARRVKVKSWREVRAERNSGAHTFYRRHTKLAVPEYSITIGLSRGFFWMTLAFGHHRVVIDRVSRKGNG